MCAFRVFGTIDQTQSGGDVRLRVERHQGFINAESPVEALLRARLMHPNWKSAWASKAGGSGKRDGLAFYQAFIPGTGQGIELVKFNVADKVL